ncbi:hypothetical protein CsSME_00034961 [Camellia sinensis var. sinensis]
MAWAAMLYYIWQERNHRVFKGCHRPSYLMNQIKSDIRQSYLLLCKNSQIYERSIAPH